MRGRATVAVSDATRARKDKDEDKMLSCDELIETCVESVYVVVEGTPLCRAPTYVGPADWTPAGKVVRLLETDTVNGAAWGRVCVVDLGETGWVLPRNLRPVERALVDALSVGFEQSLETLRTMRGALEAYEDSGGSFWELADCIALTDDSESSGALCCRTGDPG